MFEDGVGGYGRAVCNFADRFPRAVDFRQQMSERIQHCLLEVRWRGREFVRPDASVVVQCNHVRERAPNVGGDAELSVTVRHWRFSHYSNVPTHTRTTKVSVHAPGLRIPLSDYDYRPLRTPRLRLPRTRIPRAASLSQRARYSANCAGQSDQRKAKSQPIGWRSPLCPEAFVPSTLDQRQMDGDRDCIPFARHQASDLRECE